jgi:hypothetical protein
MMEKDLDTLKPDQHRVTRLPKFTTNLPFFNLTLRKKDIPKEIKYRGIDDEGRPIRWEVYFDRSNEIGAPGVDAHRVWTLLVKPSIDSRLSQETAFPNIIPLGGVRECLRSVGWSIGGHQARELIKSLTQIAFAGCIADFWLPTGEKDQTGKEKYLQIKGRYSRISVYAIGEHHLTPQELASTDFDFNLDDTLYIRLDPLEMIVQERQPQRYSDNQYLFSVKPASRRWYELVAPKIFGVIKNKGAFCEIRYSWYIKHHHTLKRYYHQKRVVFQMNRIVQEHIATGYITKVEYRKLKEPDQELDWIIRYYPGEAAKESIARILSYQYGKRVSSRKERISFKEATAKPEPAPQAEQGSAAPTEAFQPIPFELSLTTEEHNLASRLIIEFGITATKAQELVRTHPEQTKLQLEAYSHRKAPADKAGWIIRAIENSYALPAALQKAMLKREEEQAAQARRNAIDACQLCNVSGYRMLKKIDEPTGQTIEAFRQCTHDPEIEDAYI